MIRSTLFKNLAPALRDSLSDAEVGALGMWLLMSAGAYPRNITMFAKDGTGIEVLENLLGVRYIYPEGTTAEEAVAGGSINPEYRLATVARQTAVNSVSALEDLLYTVSASNEAPDKLRDEEALPMPQPVAAGDLTWHAQPFARRAVPEPVQVNVPRFDVAPERAPAFDPDTAGERRRVMMERAVRERTAELRRLEELNNRTRGIPNRR